MLTRIVSIAAAVLVSALTVTASAQAPAPTGTPFRVRGTIDALNGNVLTVTMREGNKVDVNLNPGFAVNYPVPLGMDAIVNNAFIGAAAVEGEGGRLDAVEVLVFPEAGRGSGVGHYPWDLAPNTNMTNATVTQVEAQGQGVLVNVQYPDGTKTILITPEIPVWTFTAGDVSMLSAGKYVFINARKQDDGRLTAGGVIVENNGMRPPN